jgi:hypothetical protein
MYSIKYTFNINLFTQNFRIKGSIFCFKGMKFNLTQANLSDTSKTDIFEIVCPDAEKVLDGAPANQVSVLQVRQNANYLN